MSGLGRAQVVAGLLVLTLGLFLLPDVAWSQPIPLSEGLSSGTPWCDPDIGGLWNSSILTPLERPAPQADKEFLTEEEAAAIERQVVDRKNRSNAPSIVRTEPLPTIVFGWTAGRLLVLRCGRRWLWTHQVVVCRH